MGIVTGQKRQLAGAPVISAERFARERPSYWSQTTPRLEQFVRSVNLGPGRFSSPLASVVSPERRAYIAECAFEILDLTLSAQRTPDVHEKTQAAIRVKRRIALLSAYPEQEISLPTQSEQSEIDTLTNRLRSFLATSNFSAVRAGPEIAGCGYIDRCAADLLMQRTISWIPPRLRSTVSSPMEEALYEIKVVERGFRTQDFRQLLVYAALLLADGRAPDVVGLVNPRRGTYFECYLADLTLDAAGMPSDQLLQQIIFDVSASEMSL